MVTADYPGTCGGWSGKSCCMSTCVYTPPAPRPSSSESEGKSSGWRFEPATKPSSFIYALITLHPGRVPVPFSKSLISFWALPMACFISVKL